MAWTTPKTWASGEIVSAANMNAHVRDNLSFLKVATTKGDVQVFDGTNYIRLAVGTNGYVLVADSGETSGIKWGYQSGSVIQIVSDTATAQVDSTSTSVWSDTGLSVTITPKLATSTLLVTGVVAVRGTSSAAAGVQIQLLDDATVRQTLVSHVAASGDNSDALPVHWSVTSGSVAARTFKVQIRAYLASGTIHAYAQPSLWSGVSSLVVQEFAP